MARTRKRGEETVWLEENRCPYCVHEGRCKGYKVTEVYGGWWCHGYSSRLIDERTWDIDSILAAR